MAGAGTPERAKQEAAIAQRKDNLLRDLKSLEAKTRQIAQEQRADAPEVAQRFREIAEGLQKEKVADLINFSKTVLASPGAANFERQITRETDQLAQQVAQAAQGAAQGQAKPAERMRDLVKQAASLEDRQQAKKAKLGQRAPAQPPQGQGSEAQAKKELSETPSGTPGGQGSNAPVGHIGRDLFVQEAKQLQQEAEALRRDLQKQGVDVTDLGEAIGELKELAAGEFTDQAQIDEGIASVVDKLKKAEFALRRQVAQQETVGPTLGGNPDVPADYKPLVSEYFKKLADR
jgi:hypothetical protein